MPDITSSLPWKAAKPGICVTLINMHGDANAFTLHETRFPLTVDGREDAAQLMRVFELLPALIGRGTPLSLESVGHEVAQRLHMPETAVRPLIEQLGNLLQSDCLDDDSAAEPVAYFVDMCDEHGGFSRAQFPSSDGSGELVGFRQLSTVVAPCYFSVWE